MRNLSWPEGWNASVPAIRWRTASFDASAAEDTSHLQLEAYLLLPESTDDVKRIWSHRETQPVGVSLEAGGARAGRHRDLVAQAATLKWARRLGVSAPNIAFTTDSRPYPPIPGIIPPG